MRLLVALAIGLAVAGAASAGDSLAARCKPGVHRSGRLVMRTFCGPATAAVEFRGRRLTFRHGRCTKVGKLLVVNIGTAIVGGVPRRPFFGITTSAPRDGRYRSAAILWVSGGVRHALLRTTLVLTHQRSRGTFSGTVLGTRLRATGSFRCR